MKKTIQRLFFSLCFLVAFLFANSLTANHVAGGEMTYTHLGGNTYNIQLILFHNCSAGALPTTQPVTINSLSCGVQTLTLAQNANSTTIITPICPSEMDRCVQSSGTYGLSMRKYSAILTLTSCWSTADDIIISRDLCCRDAALTTISGGTLTIPTLLKTGLNNSSPNFTNHPRPYYCVNEPAEINFGGYDSDGDSLVYSLVNCLATVYNTPFSGQNFVHSSTPISIDPQSGHLSFTPTTVQTSVVCVLVEEFRNGVKIGEITRDLNLNINNCTNNFPIASGINGTANSSGTTGIFELNVSPGDTVDFDIAAYDPNVTDIIIQQDSQSLSFFMGGIGTILGASITSDSLPNPTGNFYWIPPNTYPKTYYIDVGIQDDNCPLLGTNYYTFKINVGCSKPMPNLPDIHTLCVENNAFSIPNFSPVTDGFWSGNGLVDNIAGTFNPSLVGAGNHTLIFQIIDGTNCVYLDSISMNVLNNYSISAGIDETICDEATSFLLTGQSPLSGRWSGIGVTPSGVFSPALSGSGLFQLTYSDTLNNCVASDTKIVLVDSFWVDAGLDETVCINAVDFSLTGQTPIGGTWSGIGIGNNNGFFSAQLSGAGVFPLIYTDSLNDCVATDIKIITVQLPSFTIDAGSDLHLCQDSSAMLIGFPAGGFWFGEGVQINGSFSSTAINNPDSSFAVYRYADNICTVLDTTMIYIRPPLIVEAGQTIDTLHANDLPFTFSGYSPLGGNWSGLGVSDPQNGVFDPSLVGQGTYTVTYTYHDSLCGFVADTKTVEVLFGVSTKEILTQSGIQIYPNPFNNYIEISFEKDLQDDANLKIINVLGEIEAMQEINIFPTDRLTFNTASLSTGIYFVSITQQEKTYTFKIIKN